MICSPAIVLHSAVCIFQVDVNCASFWPINLFSSDPSMEGGSCDLNSLVEVLAQGGDQLKQLESCLDAQSPFDFEKNKQLMLQAQSCVQRAAFIAKAIISQAELVRERGASGDTTAVDSPGSNSGGSLRSDHSDRSALMEQERREMCKKRKTLRKWTSQVRACVSREGNELEDGYSWRKYGQKDILGAKHPRGYFRCTYRNTVGCLAMKQVQRSDADPSVFDITYRGDHTCNHQKPQNIAATQAQQVLQQDQTLNHHDHQDQRLLFNLQTNLKVKTQGLGCDGDADQNNSLFSFPSTPVSSFMSENNTFSAPFISPTTAESNCFRTSTSYGGELADMVSAATSGSDSSALDITFMLDSAGFDPAFPFEDSSIFQDL